MNISRIRKFTAILIVFSIFISFSPVMASDLANPVWPKEGHDNQNTGLSQYHGPQYNSTKWNYTPSDGSNGRITPPVIGPDGTIYISVDFDTPDSTYTKIYALNPDGTEKWSYNVSEEGWNSGMGDMSIGPDGTIYAGVLYNHGFFSNQHSKLYAFNPNKTVKWVFNLTDGNVSNSTFNWLSSPVVGKDGTIYFGSGFKMGEEGDDADFSNFYALNPDGTVKWNFTLPETDCSLSLPAIGQDGTIYFTNNYDSKDGFYSRLYAIKDTASKAEVKWNYTLSQGEVEHRDSSAPLIGKESTIYLANTVFNSTKNREYVSLYAFNTKGNLKWNYKINGNKDVWTKSMYSLALGPDNTIYLNTESEDKALNAFGKLFALKDLGSHVKALWSFTTPDKRVFGSMAIDADGKIYIGEDIFTSLLSKLNPPKLYALNPDGSIKWTYKINPRLDKLTLDFTSISIGSDGTLYIADFQGNDDAKNSMLYAVKGLKSNLYVGTSADNQNPKVGDTIEITFKVGNKGPDTASNTNFKYVIPEGLKYTNATADTGKVSYNATTRTVTWNLGNVPVGDPYLHLSLQVSKDGSYNIKPALSTESYDPNLSSNIGSIIINAQGSEISTVHAKTIGMQKTGIPITYLILAVLIVIGGIILLKKR